MKFSTNANYRWRLIQLHSKKKLYIVVYFEQFEFTIWIYNLNFLIAN